jgi:hypothetical protein
MRFVYPFFYYTILPGGFIAALETFWIRLRIRLDIRVQYSVLERQPRPSLPADYVPWGVASLPWSWSMFPCENFSMHAHEHACICACLHVSKSESMHFKHGYLHKHTCNYKYVSTQANFHPCIIADKLIFDFWCVPETYRVATCLSIHC